MPENTYILCPGQGAQHVGMGKDFAEASDAARQTFVEADAIVPGLSGFCFDGPEETLNQTDVSQPAIFATSVACFRAAGLETPTAYAGLSLGEYTALHLAGVFDFETGLRLVQARGRYMQDAATATPSGMVSLLGGDEAQVTDLCTKAAEGEVLVPANFNCPGQIVVSGTMSACGRVAELAAADGLRVFPLKVAGAFHSPLMQPAADRMAAELDRVSFSEPTVPVWSNVTAEPHVGVDDIKKRLVEQITQPVRWSQTIEKLVGGDASFVELAPGRVLTGLLKKIDRKAPMRTLNNAEALAADPG
ncbi:MAG: ACP S-malonyltransferase [Planctomycetota bacterium]